MPVVDAPDERRDERDAGFRAGHGLGEAEKQGEVAVNALALELFGGANALPGAADLDQHTIARHPVRLVEGDQLPRLGDAAVRIEAQARVNLRRHTARDDVQNLSAEGHRELIHERFDTRPLVAGDTLGRRARGLDERPVLGLLSGLQQQRRVGGRVLRLVLGDRLDIAGVRDDGGVALEGVEQGHSDRIHWPS